MNQYTLHRITKLKEEAYHLRRIKCNLAAKARCLRVFLRINNLQNNTEVN